MGQTTGNGNSGGSGAGGKEVAAGVTIGLGGSVGVLSTKGTILTTATLYDGNVGSNGNQQNNSTGATAGGGGGGVTEAGGVINAGSNNKAGKGGDGISINITGTSLWWGAGGGGSGYVFSGGDGGKGGGGAGGATYSGATAGTTGDSGYTLASGKNAGSGTGSGGGGATYQDFTGGSGGSGIIIIRYLSTSTSTSTSSSLELVRGTTTDGEVDYRVGNYDGVFKIKSVDAGTPTDRMVISSVGNVGIGTTTTYKLDVNGDVNISSGSSFRIGGNILTDLVGIWSSNYAYDKVGMYSSNYSDNVGVWGSNYAYDKVGMYSSNYSDKVGIWSSNYAYDKVGMYSSNYSDKVGIWSSNYAYDKVGMYSSNYSDKVAQWGSNYAYDKIGMFSSNYSDKIGVWGSNYARDKIGMFSSNYTELNALWGSNYARDKVGMWSSNYTERLIAAIPSSTNYWTTDGETNIYLNQTGNVGIGTQTSLTNKLQVQGTISASGLITGNAGISVPVGQTLTSAGTLTANIINTSGLITTTNATTGTSDSLNIRYDTRNGIRFQQRYIGTDDVGYDIIQKVANVDKTASLSFYNGNVGIGRTTLPTRILQVGTGRLGIANDNTQFTIIGTSDVVGELHTKILLFGVNCTDPAYGGTGNILYLSGNGGKHIFITLTPSVETERMRIGNNGNVAIGTTDTSTYKLRVEGSQFVNNQLVFNNSYRSGGGTDYACNKIALYGGVNTPTTTGNNGFGVAANGVEYFSGGAHIFYTGTGGGTSYGSERMRIATNGNIGIGTTDTATYRLNVNGNTFSNGTIGFNDLYNDAGANFACNKLNLFSAGSTTQYGLGISSGTLDYFSNNTHRWWTGTQPGAANNGFGFERMSIYSNGYIRLYGRLGIGAYPANYDLDIPANGTGNTGSLNLRYFNYDVNIEASTTFLSNVSARIGGSIWCGSWIASSSDTRIKEDIQDINDDSALHMILAIEPKTYKYIDKVAKGDKKVYGFIAQQIKEVLPDAVGIEPEYIPNIMLLADYDNEIITLPSQPTKVIIKLNDKIRCYDKDNKHIDIIVIEIIDELTFKIKFNDNEPIKAKEPTNNSSNIDIPDSPKYTDNKIFVSGTEVDDFHTISKEYIFTLNVCATQELHRRIISQDERIKELEAKMVDILKYLSI